MTFAAPTLAAPVTGRAAIAVALTAMFRAFPDVQFLLTAGLQRAVALVAKTVRRR